MVRSCSLGDICTDKRLYLGRRPVRTHTRRHSCKPRVHAECAVGQFSKLKNITPKVFYMAGSNGSISIALTKNSCEYGSPLSFKILGCLNNMTGIVMQPVKRVNCCFTSPRLSFTLILVVATYINMARVKSGWKIWSSFEAADKVKGSHMWLLWGGHWVLTCIEHWQVSEQLLHICLCSLLNNGTQLWRAGRTGHFKRKAPAGW